MSEAFDDFFDDEMDLMGEDVTGGVDPSAAPEPTEADEPARAADPAEAEPAVGEAPVSAQPAPAEHKDRQAPPFWMVLAIAGVSLVLGIVIGYLMGTSATIAELGSGDGQPAASAPAPEDGGSVSMPEGHPDLDVDDEGNATVADSADPSAPAADDALTRANNFFDMGMAAMEAAQDDAARQQAAGLFSQAISYYDEHLKTAPSPAVEVDRAICVFYSGDHEGAIADLEDLTAREGDFAPAWANLGMFYESHGDAAKAKKAYRTAIDAAEKDDTYGVKDYAQQRLDALGK